MRRRAAPVRDAKIDEVRPGRGYSALIEEVVKGEGIVRLGFDDAYMTVRDHGFYAKALSCELVPATELLWQLRSVKSPEELAVMERAQRIAERALEEILGEIRPGVTEKEIAARLQYLCSTSARRTCPLIPSWSPVPTEACPMGVPSEKTIARGEFVTMDFGCVYHGYCSDMTRTVAVGSADEEMHRVYETVLSAQRAGIAAARAGATGREVDGAAGR